MRVFLELAFDGTRYHGWQRQPQSITVQEVLEDTLARLFGGPCPVMGCGRTDAGVHAKYFVAHAQLPDEALGGRVSSWEEAAMKHNAKDPFLEGRSTRVYGDLDPVAMQEASAHLVRKDDFASFCKAGSDQGTTICDVREARWEVLGPHRWAFHITADRFLRNMVRATVGTLIEVGKGRRRPEEILEVLAAKDRGAAGKSVLGCGLYLTRVTYPEEVFTPVGTQYL